MTDANSEATLTQDEENHRAGAPLELAIRWVHPQPVREATWLDRPLVTLGRDPDCEATLVGDRVSRRHAVITRSGALRLISDLDSKNGVTLNGERVKEGVLTPGSVLRVGEFVGVCLEAPRGIDLSYADLGNGIYGGHRHRALVERLRELAKANLPVVLEGETGTGKERFASALHVLSERQGRFFAVNCAVYTRAVAAAELFGYKKGAFTGAEQANIGHVRAADGGTLLLDELTELDLDVQATLLRVIETSEVLALGEVRPTAVDVRFVAATQVPLELAARQGRFREDLRARLEGVVLRLPPLRACREILPELLVDLFHRHVGVRPALTSAAAERLCQHDFRLNIRELDSVARRLVATFGGDGPIERSDIEAALGGSEEPEAGADTPAKPRAQTVRRPKTVYPPEDIERLLEALTRHQGNLTRAASELKLTRQTAYRMLKASRSH